MLMLALCSMLEQEPSRQTSQGTLTYRQAYILLLNCYEHSLRLLYSINFVAEWQHLFSFSLLSPNKPVATDNILLLLLFFNRTGKRSTFGLVKDGLNSAIRYYKNNFADGFRQVSH